MNNQSASDLIHDIEAFMSSIDALIDASIYWNCCWFSPVSQNVSGNVSEIEVDDPATFGVRSLDILKKQYPSSQVACYKPGSNPILDHHQKAYSNRTSSLASRISNQLCSSGSASASRRCNSIMSSKYSLRPSISSKAML